MPDRPKGYYELRDAMNYRDAARRSLRSDSERHIEEMVVLPEVDLLSALADEIETAKTALGYLGRYQRRLEAIARTAAAEIAEQVG